MYTSVILEMGTPDFSRADLIATAPSWGAETVVKEPLNWIPLSEMLNDII